MPVPGTFPSLGPSDRKEMPRVLSCRPESPGNPSSMTSKLRTLSEPAAPTGPHDWAVKTHSGAGCVTQAPPGSFH